MEAKVFARICCQDEVVLCNWRRLCGALGVSPDNLVELGRLHQTYTMHDLFVEIFNRTLSAKGAAYIKDNLVPALRECNFESTAGNFRYKWWLWYFIVEMRNHVVSYESKNRTFLRNPKEPSFPSVLNDQITPQSHDKLL